MQSMCVSVVTLLCLVAFPGDGVEVKRVPSALRAKDPEPLLDDNADVKGGSAPRGKDPEPFLDDNADQPLPDSKGSIRSGKFANVVTLIDDMIASIHDDQWSEDAKNKFCTRQFELPNVRALEAAIDKAKRGFGGIPIDFEGEIADVTETDEDVADSFTEDGDLAGAEEGDAAREKPFLARADESGVADTGKATKSKKSSDVGTTGTGSTTTTTTAAKSDWRERLRKSKSFEQSGQVQLKSNSAGHTGGNTQTIKEMRAILTYIQHLHAHCDWFIRYSKYSKEKRKVDELELKDARSALQR